MESREEAEGAEEARPGYCVKVLHHDTFHRIIGNVVDPEVFDQVVGRYLTERRGPLTEATR